jgi:hypothetical protein
MRLVKEQSKELIDYYEKYFKRTSQKFIRRTPLEESDYGREFVLGKDKYIFLGQSSEVFYVIQKENGDYFMVNPKIIEPAILKARE